MSFQDYLIEAVSELFDLELPEDVLAEAAMAQACFMAGIADND